MFKISAPTKMQWIHTVEYVVVGFGGSAVAVWIKQPNPFSKAAVIVALTAGIAGVAGILKGVLTTI